MLTEKSKIYKIHNLACKTGKMYVYLPIFRKFLKDVTF